MNVRSHLVIGLALMLIVTLGISGGCPLNPFSQDTSTDEEAECTECPEPTVVDVHLFKYDTETGEYMLGDRRISEAAVKRDLNGQLCGRCHPNAMDEFKDTVHYKWAGRNDRVLFPGGGAHGMIDRACGLPASTSLINFTSDVNIDECGKCHPGRFMPMMQGMFAGMFTGMGLANGPQQAARIVEGGVDCLICHAEEYRSYPADGAAKVADYAPADGRSPTAEGFARVARDDTDFDGDGTADPLIDSDGDGVADMPLMMDRDGDGTPETPWPTIAQDRSFEALSSIGRTTDEHCLRCHEHARTGYKRGTLFRPGHDVHSDSEAVASLGGGEGRHCVACHTPSHHKFVRGHHVGGDLMASDYEVGSAQNELECTKCHAISGLTGLWHISGHTDKLACETCHIPYSSGITYSLYGNGGQLNFGRNDAGMDAKLISADHLLDEHTDADVNSDWEAYRTRPTLMWFDGNVSFLAQSLAVRGMPGAKITPFKPMANGMVFDARFFSGEMANNEAMGGAYQYNAHSMYRFQAGGANADIFYALDFFDLTPEEVRNVTLDDFQSPDPDRQAMALMQIFPNMVLFDKVTFDLVRYTTGSNSPWDANDDGYVDAGVPFYYDMLAAGNNGLRAFQGFNAPMGLDPTYEWYPAFADESELITIESARRHAHQDVPRHAGHDAAARAAAGLLRRHRQLSGLLKRHHARRPRRAAQGAGTRGRPRLHRLPTPPAARWTHLVPVTNTEVRVMGSQQFEFPVYRWKYYNVHALTDLGLATTDEDIVAGTADVDVHGNATYVQESSRTFVVNYMAPAMEGSYRAADDADSLAGTSLTADDMAWNGGSWMAVLEPDVRFVPNYEVLGYTADEILFLD